MFNLKIRKVINKFLKDQTIQIDIVYATTKDGEYRLPCMKDEYYAYEIHRVTLLMLTKMEIIILDPFVILDRKIFYNRV
jgi:hypothetical protein